MWILRGRAFLSHYLRNYSQVFKFSGALSSWQSHGIWLQLFTCSNYAVTTHGLTMGVSSSQQRLLTSGQRWCIQDTHDGFCLSWNKFNMHETIRSFGYIKSYSWWCCSSVLTSCSSGLFLTLVTLMHMFWIINSTLCHVEVVSSLPSLGVASLLI